MEILFLGTGPVGGIKGKGRSKRLESSILIDGVLVDVTNHFKKQIKGINNIKAILITHAHKDAIGGMNQLRGWQKKVCADRIRLYSLKETIKKIKNEFKSINNLEFINVKPYKDFKIDNLKVIAFKIKHSIQKGFPTLGFYFPDLKLVYASDVGELNKDLEKYSKKSKILIIDGAMWEKKLIAHLDIKEVLPKICNWNVKKIIFTQIGKTAPKYESLRKEIKKICSKALPAYDGMKLRI
ncbi:hypothetical protein HY498_05585 [Candidatus Woesearchaeota archaeon]|nr:hypothetical protein [Candidatus Woesearchaeota archaeon]